MTSGNPAPIVMRFLAFFPNDIQLGEALAIHLYRIAEEIVLNTIKHAGVTQLQLSLRFDNKNWLYLKKTMDEVLIIKKD